MISALISAAREYCESEQARVYITQTWELVLDKFPENKRFIQIPLPVLQSVASVKYKDQGGVEATWDASNYIIDTKSQPGRIMLGYNKSWPSIELYPAGAITIEFKAGYGDDGLSVPESIKAAIKLILGHLYEHREEVNIGNIVNLVPVSAKALLAPGKILIP